MFKPDMPTALEVIEGEAASVTCSAEGKPSPTYAWIKRSSQKNLGISSDRFTVNEVTGVLNILRVARDDNGIIKCIANNGAGIVERDVKLTVIVKPHIMELRNLSMTIDKEAVLECKATGNPLPSITFRLVPYYLHLYLDIGLLEIIGFLPSEWKNEVCTHLHNIVWYHYPVFI